MRPSHCTTVTSPTGRLSRRSGISPPSIRLRFTALSMADRLAFPDYNELTTSGTVPFALEVLREFQPSTVLQSGKWQKPSGRTAFTCVVATTFLSYTGGFRSL